MVRSRDLPTNRKVSSQKARVLDLPVKWCGGWDLNPRTPTGRGPELRAPQPFLTRLSSRAFDLSWQPPLVREISSWSDKAFKALGACKQDSLGLDSRSYVFVIFDLFESLLPIFHLHVPEDGVQYLAGAIVVLRPAFARLVLIMHDLFGLGQTLE